jgi:hypothetical protein
VSVSRENIVPFTRMILDCFDTQLSLLECVHQLKDAGLQFDETTDLAKESEFFETVKSIALEAAWVGNENVKKSEFALDFLLIMHGRMELNRRAFVDLIVGMDTVLNHDPKATRDLKGGLKAVLVFIKKSHPDLLTWLPLKYQQFVRTFKGT